MAASRFAGFLGVAASMTWLVMPRLAAAFAAWLYASPLRRRSAGKSPADV